MSRLRSATLAGSIAAGGLLGASALAAAEVTLRMESGFTWVGEPIGLELKITNPERGMGGPELPPTAGLVLELASGPRQETSIANGQMSQSVTYIYSITPAAGQSGKFTIGPAAVPRAGGTPLRSNTLELEVLKKPASGINFRCAATPPQGWTGHPFRLVYTVQYTGDAYEEQDDFFPSFFRQSTPLGLAGLELPVLELAGVRLTPTRVLEDRPGSTVRLASGAQIILQQGFERSPEGYGYKTLVFGFEVVPTGPGPIKVPRASVLMHVNGPVELVRDAFGRRVRHVRRVEQRASTEEITYVVRDLPEEGRPPGFNGAVGRYAITVKASSTEVDAFAPITLEITVTGQGLLDQLRPPIWSEVESLTREFEVSTDVDSGKVEGGAKLFRQVIRPRSERTPQVPPIPFPYFDPYQGRYQVALSQPIPITVRAVKTVGGDDAIPSARALPDPSLRPAAAPTIVDRAGIGANFSDLGRAQPSLDPRAEVLSLPFLAAAFAPPLILGVLAVARRLARRDPRQRLKARALAEAGAILNGSGADWDRASGAFQDYFRRRFDLPSGEITPPDLALELERRAVPAAVREAARDILERLLAGRFGGGGEPLPSVAARALKALQEVDRCALG